MSYFLLFIASAMMQNIQMVKVCSTEFQRSIKRYQDIALTEPVIVTRNGREHVVMISVDEYDRLMKRDRKAGRAEDLPNAILEKIESTAMDKRHNHLNK